MSKQQDGGPAYPCRTYEEGKETHGGRPLYFEFVSSGMSLRDAFAMAALTGVLASQEEHWDVTKGGQEEFFARAEKGWAEFCYRQADAMLVARSSTVEPEDG